MTKSEEDTSSGAPKFMQHLVDFVAAADITVRLAYNPPYQSKYNPIERCWGILEQHWNGALLDSITTAVQFAKSITWKGRHPMVTLVNTVYHNGVKLTKAAMAVVETQLNRDVMLGKWFIDIVPAPESR